MSCQPTEDKFSLDDPDVRFNDITFYRGGPAEDSVDCPGLQVKPWPCMKAFKVTFTHGNTSPSTYLTPFSVSFDEFSYRSRVKTLIDVFRSWPF